MRVAFCVLLLDVGVSSEITRSASSLTTFVKAATTSIVGSSMIRVGATVDPGCGLVSQAITLIESKARNKLKMRGLMV